MEADSALFRRRAVERPEDLSVWTKLYTASQMMLSAMQEHRVTSALGEICSNLLGCEEWAIVELPRGTSEVQFVAAEGLSAERRGALAGSRRILESRMQSGSLQIVSDQSEREAQDLDRLGITAVVPAWSDEKSCGAILLFQLLPQRTEFEAEDRKVLQLLSNYAGRCLKGQNSA